MAYDEGLATRLQEIFAADERVSQRKMFGGLALMFQGNMFVGVTGDELMVRVGKQNYVAALAEPHAREMDFTGKPLTGYVYVAADGIAEDEELQRWCDRALSFAQTLPAK
jgi:TfoX/Sxy family transcriptional regulator of competence genes